MSAGDARAPPQHLHEGGGGAGGGSNGGRPPAKRARKAINCEPCRMSKLKCDRARPCSSCVLRGTSSQCYQDGLPPAGASDSTDPTHRGPPRTNTTRIDPAHEIAKVRAALSRLESFVSGSELAPSLEAAAGRIDLYSQAIAAASSAADRGGPDAKLDLPDPSGRPPPGAVGRQSGGLYAGPTSAVSFIHTEPSEKEEEATRQSTRSPSPPLGDYDRDLLAQLPQLSIIEQLFEYYFSYCKWIFRYVNHNAFNAAWTKYKTGQSTDRLALATACVILSVATYYLPKGHHLRDTLEQPQSSEEEAGQRYYYLGMTVLDRHLAENRKYSLELVELHLVRCHYLMLSKKDGEAIWAIKGDLVTMGTAMGLHRDPGKWKMSLEAAERRRWAWWNLVYLERLQSWLFGRPILVSPRHFDTQMPSYCPPSVDPAGRFYVSQIAMFKLGELLGTIVSDAVSLRPVSYENVLEHDRALEEWLDDLPQELQLDEFGLARGLASPDTTERRRAVQSIIIRAAYQHYRLTLHRPYASKAVDGADEYTQSLDIAVACADKLISLCCSSHAGFLSNTALAVPGHMSWGGFHIFSAAMFFSFQLIARPHQPGAALFRANVTRAMDTLRATQGVMPVADTSYNILQALTPLYADDAAAAPAGDREKQKQSVLRRVQNLAFPYHDTHARRAGAGAAGSPALRTKESPGHASSPASLAGTTPVQAHSVPPLSPLGPPLVYGPAPAHAHAPHAQYKDGGGVYAAPALPPPPHAGGMHAPLSPSLSRHDVAQLGHMGAQHTYFQPLSLSAPHGYFGQFHAEAAPAPPGHPLTPGSSGVAQQLNPEAQMMWGAAIGFEQGEWSQLMESMQAPPQRM